MTSLISKNSAASASKCNYKLLINFCLEHFIPTSEYFTVIIAHSNNLRIYCLKRLSTEFEVIYICETCDPINELIFCNFHDNAEVYLLLERNNFNKSLIPDKLIPKIKIKKWYSFENVYALNSNEINFKNGYRDFKYSEHPPPKFAYRIQDLSNFEAMIYYTLNSAKLFMGEAISILIPKSNKIYVYIFRRLLLHFLLESNFMISTVSEITEALLNFPQAIVKILENPFPDFKIPKKCKEIKTLPEILKKGLNVYEKVKNEKALAIFGTQKYFNVLAEAKLNLLLASEYSENLTQQIISTKAKKKIIIEIKNDGIRVLVMEKITGKKLNIVFSYPENNAFIPMYISFLRKTVVIGKNAIQDYNTHPEFVIFDVLKIAGKTLKNPPKINPEWGFQLVPINDSNNPKLGIKVQTFNGTKIFPVEIILAFLFKYLLRNIAADHFETTEFTLRFFQQNKLKASEKNVFWEVSKILKLSMILNCEK